MIPTSSPVHDSAAPSPGADEAHEFTLAIDLGREYTQTVDFGEPGVAPLTLDEPPLEPVVPAEQHDRVPRCLALFEDFCTVTQSVRQSIDVQVEVQPRSP